MNEPLAYYNEIDPYAAAWLRNLIDAGHIAKGVVDTRSIEDILPGDLDGFTQCHFFAGIGVWSYALRLAGWPDERPVWTGSCPCQPFSTAGKGAGFADERHLWPAWHHLLLQCRPPVVFGEQVASKDADAWLDLVQDDMEAVDYAIGAVPFPAAGVGAPHIRDRLYWVAERLSAAQVRGLDATSRWPDHNRSQLGMADAGDSGLEGRSRDVGRETRGVPESGSVAGELADPAGKQQVFSGVRASQAGAWLHRKQGLDRDSEPGGLGDADKGRSRRHAAAVPGAQSEAQLRPVAVGAEPAGDAGQLADPDGGNASTERQQRGGQQRQQPQDGGSVPHGGPGPTNGFWATADWLHCRDAKWRPVEPGAFPLVDGPANRVGRLRAYGNAIVAPAAAAFIASTGLV